MGQVKREKAAKRPESRHIVYFDDLIIYPLGGEINAKASHESLWKQVLRGTNEGRRVQRKALDKIGSG